MIAPGWLIPGVLAVLAALPLGYWARIRLPFGRWQLVTVYGGTAAVHAAYLLSLLHPALALPALQSAFVGSLVQGAALVSFCQALISGLEGGARPPSQRQSLTLGAIVGVLGLFLWLPQGLYEADPVGMGRIAAGELGRIACGGLLLELLFAMAGLEQLLRQVREPLHYQLKFLLLGLGVQLVAGLYATSSFLLRAVWQPEFALVQSLASLLGCGLASVAMTRLRRTWAPGRQPLDASDTGRPLSFLVAGAFLVTMGAASLLLPRGATMSQNVLVVTVVTATGAAIAVVVASRYVRTVVKRFLARSFRKTKYDYRARWLEVITAFHGVTSLETILDRLPALLGRTFSASRISVWMRSSTDGTFHQVRSVNVESPPPPLAPTHPLVVLAAKSPSVLRNDDPVCAADDFCEATRMRVLGPIWSDKLLGFVLLSDDIRRNDYDQDDIDLLQAMTRHVGMLIAYAELAAAHRAAAELRALHELSVFCIHDLKNLAGRLSLVAQNSKRFGDNPEFQQSAFRTVATTAERMMALIQKLSPRANSEAKLSPRASSEAEVLPECSAREEARPRTDQDPKGESADLFETLASATETLREGIELSLPPVHEPRTPVRLPAETLRSILLNIIGNAEQAMGETGRLTISARPTPTEWLVTLTDTGPGISPEALAKLFEPFGTTKRSGLGVGLFQCKRTLEAAGGSIAVSSELGDGTSVTLSLPISPTSLSPASGSPTTVSPATISPASGSPASISPTSGSPVSIRVPPS